MPPELGKLTTLEYLTLFDNPVTDADLECLTSLTRLTYLSILKTDVTREGAETIRKALPECENQERFHLIWMAEIKDRESFLVNGRPEFQTAVFD